MMKCFVAAITGFFLAGCTAPSVQDYAAQGPRFDLRQYFDGRVEGWGVVQDRTGHVTRRMTVIMECAWKGDVGTFDERFTYADGRTESRVWTIRRNGDRYAGTAGDVIGEATGQTAGPAFNWTYVLAAKRDNGDTVNLDMDDWMWMLDARTVANRTAFSKFGFRLGEVTFFFRKVG